MKDLAPAPTLRTTGHPALGISMLGLAELLERFSYYGLRSVLVLYMTNSLLIEKEKAISLYGNFTALGMLLVLIGGIAGDLLTGPALAIIIGAGLEALGCFAVCIPHPYALIAGLILIALGAGFFKPNILSQAAALYRFRTAYVDAGYAILYCAINLGAFLAPIAIGAVSDASDGSYVLSFACCAVAALLAAVPVLVNYKELKASFQQSRNVNRPGEPVAWLALFAGIFFPAAFWILYSLIQDYVLECGTVDPQQIITVQSSVSVLLMILIGAVLWSFVRVETLYKVAAGFVLIILAFSWTQLVESCSLIAPLISTLAEIMVAMPVLALIARFAPPKWAGTFFGISLMLTWGTNKAASFFMELSRDHRLTGAYTEHWYILYLVPVCVACITALVLLARYMPKEHRIR